MRKARGAATVEMALSLIVLIPLFLYALFLSDLLRYYLDQQEAVLSTPWDFTVQSYSASKNTSTNTESSIQWTVQHQARLMFCDHESGFDSYNQEKDCNGLEHHVALVAHVCWKNPKAKEVSCEGPDARVGVLRDRLYAAHDEKFMKLNGMYQCSGFEVVQNYLLPEKFLQKFSKVDSLVNHRWHTGEKNIHENAEAGTGWRQGDTYDENAKYDTYFLEEQRMAILAGPGALDTPQEVTRFQIAPRGDSTAIHARMRFLFENSASYEPFTSAVANFRMYSDQLLLRTQTDDPTKPRLFIRPFPPLSNGHGSQTPERSMMEESGRQDYAFSPWNDGEFDAHRKTYERRGEQYMGCPAGGCQ